MTRHRRRGVLATGVAAALLLTAVATGASAGPTKEELAPNDEATVRAPEAPRDAKGDDTPGDDDAKDAIAAAADAYQRVYPALDRKQAEQAAGGQEHRKRLHDAVLEDRHDQFGGAWFDPPTGVLHVAVTSDGLAKSVDAYARETDLQVEVHRVKHSFDELDRQAAALRLGRDEVGKAAQGRVGIDVTTNTVVAQVPKHLVDDLSEQAARDGVRIEVATGDVELDACNHRADCNDSVRAGSVLWRTWSGNPWCSAGVTGRSSATNLRYVFTAGHCSNGNGVTWGTGSGTVGTMAFSANSGNLDAGAIRVNNWPYTWHPGGDIWMQLAANRRVDMDDVAPSQSWIWVGDTVCLAANYTSPSAIGNRCGVVGANADATAGGKTRVDGVDACGGDSGGGWYWLFGSGNRWGYGIHSSSNFGCNGSLGGDTSWFTTLPRVKSWFPAIQFETS